MFKNNIIDLCSSVIALNINGLNILIKRQVVSQDQIKIYTSNRRNTLNIRKQKGWNLKVEI